MDPEGAIYAIAMNQQKKKASESYARSELPQITKKHLKTSKNVQKHPKTKTHPKT